MAGGRQTREYKTDPEIKRRWELSRRTDLADAFGIVLSMPAHGQDDAGNWEYGRVPVGGMSNQQLVDEFQIEMLDLVRQHASSLRTERLLSSEQFDKLGGHAYSVGPAAQEWPRIFFEIYRDVRPILSDGASVLGWGYFIRDLITRINWWSSNKQEEVQESMRRQKSSPKEWGGISVFPVLTLPAVVALCYTDLVKRYGIGDDVIIDTYPRSNTEYATPDHPAGGETYLVRLKAGRRGFFYLVDASGVVSEHFLATGSDLTLLPIPNLFGDDPPYHPRQSQSSYRVKTKGNSARAT